MRAATAVVTSGAFERRFHPEMSLLEGMGGPDMAPHPPQRSEPPGEAVALLDTPTGSAAPATAAGGPATGIIFREVSADYDLDWHPAPRRQYIVNLDAGVQITASDGETRRIGAGEVLLVEDTWGKGHRSKALDGKPRHCIFVPVD